MFTLPLSCLSDVYLYSIQPKVYAVLFPVHPWVNLEEKKNDIQGKALGFKVKNMCGTFKIKMYKIVSIHLSIGVHFHHGQQKFSHGRTKTQHHS